MKINIQPLQEQIDNWITKYVPEKDFYFIKNDDLQYFENYLGNVLLIPREEFFQHSSYKQVQIVNSYEYWKISNEAQFIIVASSEWFINLPLKMKKFLNSIQVKIGRGLILELPESTGNISFTEDNIVEENGNNYIVLQSDMWRKLPYFVKESVIQEYAKKWDDWACYEFPKKAPIHLQKYANTFPSEAGSNCLSATLFAISKQEWMIHEWVHPKTFLQALSNAHYFLTNNEELCAGDVVTWENSDGIIQHAAYHIVDNFFFNKDGQTFFNPWKITSWSEIKEDWKEYRINIYRKNL